MKPISSWIFKLAFWLLTTLVVLLLIVYPMLSSWLLETGKLLEAELVQPIESAQFWLMGVLASLWVFALGSCFGSFLEVVAERVPRGRSINGSSRCPDCDQKLRFRDNTPIIGWLRCGGKCSNCNSKIPVRYLIVEIVLGAIFLLVAKIQLMGMGSNLPFREISKPNELWLLFLELKNPILDLPIIAFDPKFDLVAITIYHLILTCFLFTFVLIRSENLKIPYRIWICGIIFGILVPLVWPCVHLVSWKLGGSIDFEPVRFSMSQMLTILVGFLLGYLVGSVFQFWKRFEQEHPSVFQPSFIEEELAAFSLIGIFLGWQSVLSIAMVATLLLIVLRCFRVNLKFLGISGAVFGVTIAHILLWRPTTSLNYWPSGDSNGLLITAFTVLLVVLIFTASKIRGHFAKESTPI